MINQKFVYSLKKAINLFMVIALVMAGVAVNVSPVSAVGTVDITSPTNGSPANVKSGAELNVVFKVTDLAGAGQYRILLGAVTFGPYDYTFTSGATVTQKITIPTLADGTYDLRVEARLNTQTVWDYDLELGAVVVDNTPPAPPKLTAPNGGDLISNAGTFIIKWDQVAISEPSISLQYSADAGASWTAITNLTNSSSLVSYEWTVPDIVTTQALVKIIVTDLTGNTSADQSDAPFTIYGADSTPPINVAMVNPEADPTVNPPYIGGTVALTATASDTDSGISSVVFQYSAAAGGPWTTAGIGVLGTGGYVFNFDTTPLTDGATYYFRAVATNGAGASTASDPVNAKIENTPPVMTLLKPAAENAWLKANYQFEVQASDAQSGIKRLEISELSGSTWNLVCSSDVDPAVGGVYTLSCLGTPSETATKIKAVVTNGAGKTSTVERAVQVDTTAPIIPPNMLTAPADSAVLQLGTNMIITWATTPPINEPHLGTTPIRLELRRGAPANTVVIAAALPITPGTYTWTVAGVMPSNDYSVCIVVSDLAGNPAEDCNSPITIWGTDTTAPTVDLAPIASPNKGIIALSAVAADPESGIQKVQFSYKKVGDLTYTNIGSAVTSAPYTVIWDSSTVNGAVLFKAVATNGVGTVAEDIFGPVLIDNTMPLVSNVSPAEYSTLAGSVIFSAQVTDEVGGSGIASVTFAYGLEVSSSWQFTPIGAGTYNPGTEKYDAPAWDTTAFADGTAVIIKVTASDNAGNEKEEVFVGYEINNAPPTFPFNLLAGWNLISLPLIPDDPAIEIFLSELIANESVIQVVAWPFEGDTIHEKRWNGAALQDVTEIVDGVGYWVEMSKPDVLTFTGDYLPEPPAAPPSYIVHAGWNLIGFLSMDDVEAEVYLGEAGQGNMRAMYGFDESTGYYEPITLDDDLDPGNGYWLAISVDATIYPYRGGGDDI